MSTEDNDTHEADATLTIAVIGGGAVLLWLLLRGRGKGSGQFDDNNGSRTPAPPSARRRLVVRTRPGDRVEVDGIDMDLATVLLLARNAGSVEFHTSSDARAGWVSKVFYALSDAGVDISTGPEIRQPVTRFPANDKEKTRRPP